MDIGDVAGKALEKAGVKAASDALKVFLEKLVGPAGEEVGLLLADQVRRYRFANQIRIFERAREIAEGAGIEPTAVPLRTLAPLLEGAQLEDDPDLSELWAQLIARAAGSGGLHPAFPRILAELTPLEATLFSKMFRDFGAPWKPRQDATYDEAQRVTGREKPDLALVNLARLGLISIDLPQSEVRRMHQDAETRDVPIIFDRRIAKFSAHMFRLTPLGAAFLIACNVRGFEDS